MVIRLSAINEIIENKQKEQDVIKSYKVTGLHIGYIYSLLK